MIYTPENERMVPPIERLIAGLHDTRSAALERIAHHGEYRNEHLKDLSNLVAELTALELRLRDLKKSTY